MPEESSPENHKYYCVEITEWNELVDIYTTLNNKNQRWLYRGQADSEWPLKTSLERFHEKITDGQENRPLNRKECERETYWQFIRSAWQFIRSANLFNASNRATEECLYWLSMMQHYAAPTRLLDFTRSFYVALFFALEEAALPTTGPKNHAAIWVINQAILDGQSNELPHKNAHKKEQTVNSIVWKSLNGVKNAKVDLGIIAAKPWILNDRIAIQQGYFIVPMDVEKSFVENMAKTLGFDSTLQNYKIPEKSKIVFTKKPSGDQYCCADRAVAWENTALLKIKIKIDRNLLMEAMSNLYRMNISATTLFPGLEGYGRGMKSILWNYACTKGE